jgi:hypothetical protein
MPAYCNYAGFLLLYGISFNRREWMFNIFAKVIIVEYKNSISIYDSFDKVKRDSALLEHVNSDMSIKGGITEKEAVLCSDGESDYHVKIFAVNRFKYQFLDDVVRTTYEHFKSSFIKSAFDVDNFSAYSFRKYSN